MCRGDRGPEWAQLNTQARTDAVLSCDEAHRAASEQLGGRQLACFVAASLVVTVLMVRAVDIHNQHFEAIAWHDKGTAQARARNLPALQAAVDIFNTMWVKESFVGAIANQLYTDGNMACALFVWRAAQQQEHQAIFRNKKQRPADIIYFAFLRNREVHLLYFACVCACG